MGGGELEGEVQPGGGLRRDQGEVELVQHTSLLADPETGLDQQVASLAVLLRMEVMMARPCTTVDSGQWPLDTVKTKY